jgi:hypothetical protein
VPRRFAPLAIAATLALVAAPPAAAQVIRVPVQGAPSAWVSLAAGIVQFGDVVDDGTTNSAWDFQTAAVVRGSIEREYRRGTSYGVAASYARPAMRYTTLASSGGAARVRGAASVASLGALFRAGGGAGLHQVIEVSLGARRYSGFRADGGGDLAPEDGDLDFTGGLGFGFGYPLGERAAVTLVQDADFSFHQREKGAGTEFDGGIHRSYVTRLGLRYGFGSRGRAR